MLYLSKIVGRIGWVGALIGSSCLLGIMVLTVANVVARTFGPTIIGTYELIELMMVVAVAFALGYTALNKGHIVVRILVSRFSQRTRAVVEIFTSVISIGFWASITWASIQLLCQRWLGEQTEALDVPYLPFRFVWVFGLSFLCLVILIDLFRARSQARDKWTQQL